MNNNWQERLDEIMRRSAENPGAELINLCLDLIAENERLEKKIDSILLDLAKHDIAVGAEYFEEEQKW